MYNPSAYPFIRLCLAFALGIILQDELQVRFDPTILFYCSIPVCAFASLFVHPKLETVWISGVLILGTICIMGMKAYHSANELTGQKDHFSHLVKAEVFVGVISDLPESTVSGAKCRIRVEQIKANDSDFQSASGSLQLYIKSDSTSPILHYGDLVAVRCSAMPIPSALNPDAFDYAWYMHTQNVHYQAFVRSDSLIFLESNQGNIFWKYTFAARQRVLDALRNHFTNQEELGVAEALLVGYKGNLPDELQNAYIETGSMHILAVSGAHVGIIFLGVMFMLKKVYIRHRYWRMIETGILLASIWGFAFLAGMGPSIARATVMFSFYLMARAFRLDYEGYNIIAASAFCLLVYDPLMLFQVSFQLSFLAVFGMMVFYPQLYKLSPVMPKWVDYFWKIFLLGLAAQLGTLPVSLLYFHQFPIYFWLSGLIVVPVASLYMYGAAVLLFIDWLAPTFSHMVAQPVILLVKGMNLTIYGIQKLPWALLDGIWLRWWEVLLFALLMAFLALHLLRPQGKWVLAMSFCFLCLSLSHFVKEWMHSDQIEVIVYHTGSSKTLLLDITHGHQIHVFGPDERNEKVEKFSAMGHRTAMGTLRATDQIGSQIFENMEVKMHGNSVASLGHFIQTGEQTYAVLDKPFSFQPIGQPVQIDALIVQNCAGTDIGDCLAVLAPNRIIIGQSLKRKEAQKWIEAANERNIPVHEIAKLGAWQRT